MQTTIGVNLVMLEKNFPRVFDYSRNIFYVDGNKLRNNSFLDLI